MRTKTTLLSVALPLGIALSLALAASPAFAKKKKKANDEDTGPRRVQVDFQGSTYIEAGGRITSISVASGDVAEVTAFPPDQLLVAGKAVGQTTATIWRGSNVESILIEVTYPLGSMRSALRRALPHAANLDVQQAGTSVVLSGEVASAGDIEKAEDIVSGFTGGAPVINALGVVGDQQVQLEVSFAEVSRTGLRQIGFNFWAKGKANADAVALTNTPLNGTFGAIFSTALGEFPFSAALSILSNKGYARVMAEPTLVAMSGKSATFLAGGEFPIPLPQSLGTIGVEYKKFGIQLDFVPTIVGDDIQVACGVTVSDIDFSLGVKLATVTVPGLTSRHADTTVRVKDGQSFVIAGLLSDKVRSSVDKVPWLGDVPILGTLFRSSSYRREETELLVVITAHRVRPTDERPELPGEHDKVDPSDLELFMLGRIESLPSDDEDHDRRADRQHGVPVGAVGFKR